ncbi:MAG: ABC transporter [Gammaproteobacteria bacterium]|nr:MAG: ABC transporter [Gammaproteobacteria bacterium]
MSKFNQSGKPILIAEDLSWRVQNTNILDNLNFSVNAADFVGIIGPNGAGKSSLLRCLYKKYQPSSGSIHFLNKPLKDYSRKEIAQHIAVVLQEPPTQFELTVLDVIRMGLIPKKALLSFDSSEDKQAIDEAASSVDLHEKLGQPFNSLSGGEKQRAMIARAILQSPRLLLMDEPTNHLDIRHQLEVLQLAKTMDTTVIVSIHDLNLAATFCDHLILLDQGKIVAQGSVLEVLSQQNIQQVFGVSAEIDQQPFSKKIRISFDLQAQSGASNE